MGNTLKRLSVTSVATVAIFAAATVTNASAASGGASCSTNGATGSMTFTNWSDNYVDISGWVKDTAADGHHVAIQFISSSGGGGIENLVHWPWRHEYGGNGSTLSFTTHASTSDNSLRYAGVHVAVWEGDKIVGNLYCSDWA
ncbi:hypothetical protein ACWDU8_14300 [Streptomyces sp. NPDC003388]|uniref:hypothetical protein n=1 Tax=unclassified Streptomyces TaxID=2593676 RepID=UPI0011682C8E|nr:MULTISPECIES: hypothetical protein [unclassified Streptomyces]MDI1457682.1 hypothetical protein [Streptomyces sp. ATE26]GEJ98319.1 hypothetical protein TNCT1_05960 [Streptomyces sp. 1-11]